MRKALNENPVVQIAVVAVLIVIVGFVFMMNMGGGGGGGESASTDTGTTPGTPTTPGATAPSTPATGGATVTPVSAPTTPLGPEPPAPVQRAYETGDTIVLLVTRPGGIEDRFVKRYVEAVRGTPGVSTFIIPAAQIANYSHLTEGLQVSRVPAMVVVSPKYLGGEQPVAQVSYGYRSPASIKQAVRDAEYEGQPASYGPE